MDKNKISFVEFMDDVEANYDPVETVHWHGKDIEVKKVLDLSEILGFVSDVITACYPTQSVSNDTDDEVPVYTPELRLYAINYMTIVYYTNIDLDVSGSSSYDFINHSNIIEKIYEVIDMDKYDAMIDSLNKKIAYINESNIFEMTKDFSSFNDTIQNLGPTMAGIAETFDKDEMKKIMDTLSKIQDDNALRDMAIKSMGSVNDDIIEFAKQIGGDDNGGND